MSTTRRSVMRNAAAIAVLTGWDPALAQTPSGHLRVGMTASAIPLPNGCPDQGAEGQRFMGITLYDQLVSWDLSRSDVASKLRPCLATDWKPDPANAKRWIFTLRQGVKFHDGKTLTAADVAFSFDRAFKRDAAWFDPRASAQVSLRIPTLESWGAEGESTFWVQTRIVDSTVPFGVTWVGITHRAAWEAAGNDWNAYLDRPVGTGPWKMAVFKPRERCVLNRNAEYWEAARIPKCADLTLLPIPEANTRVAALRAGQVDFIEAPPPDSIDSLKSAGFQIYTNTYPHNWTWHLSMVEGSPFRDLRVRKAINLAVDRAGMKELLGGLMLEGQGLVTKSNPWYGKPTFALTHDPEAAKKLLTEAGYGPAKPLQFKVGISTSGSGQMQPLTMNEFLQQNLQEIGVKVEFEVFDWNALIDVSHAGAKSPLGRGVAAINFTYFAGDPYSAFIRLLKSSLAAPVGQNWGYFDDPSYDELFAEIYKTFDPVALDVLLGRVHARIVDDALFIFVAHDLNPRALAAHVKGFTQAQSWFQDLTPITTS